MAERGEYRIGTVSKLTGVDPHTIRAWERRYQAIVPRRTGGGTRLYADEDVHRLRLLKAVTDAGDSIGVVAQLDDGSLRQRLAALAGAVEAAAGEPEEVERTGPARVAVLGEPMADRLRDATSVRVEVRASSPGELVADARDVELDALVLHLPALGSEPGMNLERLLAATSCTVAVVFYEFAKRRTLAELSRRGALLVRGPLAPNEMDTALADLLAVARAPRRRQLPPTEPGGDETPPDRLYDDAQLARMREIVSSVQCECPTHLASIVECLVAFEAYSRRCESVDAEDAELHARLGRGTGRARAIMEQLLVEICEYDDLAI